jgi:aspartate-semialdehyde dehydrogenase
VKKPKKIRLALIGTDSLRGREMKELLSRKKSVFGEVEFFDPEVEEEYSKLTEFGEEPRVVHSLDKSSIKETDLVFLAADKEINRQYGNLAAEKKYHAIDLSETFNLDDDVPLIVAGVNDQVVLDKNPPLIANPHPVTIILSHLFFSILKRFQLLKAVSFVLQPVSVYEESGIEELAHQSVAVLNSAAIPKKTFKAQIAFNLLTQIDNVDKDGFSSVEKQITAEIQRVLHIDNFAFSLSLVQAPVFHTYSIMTHVELSEEAELESLAQVFKESSYFKAFRPSPSCPASSVLVAGKDEIFIGQIKREESFPNRFWIWTVADNLTRGSSLNAYEVAVKIVLASAT